MVIPYTKTINGVQIAFDDTGLGRADIPTIVLLPGWCHDMRAWNHLLPYLSPHFRVVRVCWRGHGPNRDPVVGESGDFGLDEQISDTIALLDSLEVETFIPVSHAHGGWVALSLVNGLGKERVPAVVLLDLIMTPPPAEFKNGLQAMQSRQTWKMARQALADSWAAETTNQAVIHHFLYEAGGHGFDMWSRSCRVIERAYGTWGSPMGLHESRICTNGKAGFYDRPLKYLTDTMGFCRSQRTGHLGRPQRGLNT
ncbi:hypothetical protein FE257_004942 [Aspergillus nanangensis]|uniref:PI-PLC Y-box domain-containing protein n=1 Tax=Aspergillus nanangensis TaxID=2582783 RepID=A0AAD4CAH7_ASPNN|nr:hypothetical protein FE257_004942 [Aspergillus nanangensis]